MLYYRTHASRHTCPPELAGYVSTGPEANLTQNIVGEHLVFGIVPSFVFDPPSSGWQPIHGVPGWEAVSVGPFSPVAHIRTSSPWRVSSVDIDGQPWGLPHVLLPDGTRAFAVTYGGPDFSEILTPEQSAAQKLATEIRTALINQTLPDMSIRARWAARLLPLVYCLSEGTLQILGMSEALINQTIQVAAGHYEQRG